MKLTETQTEALLLIAAEGPVLRAPQTARSKSHPYRVATINTITAKSLHKLGLTDSDGLGEQMARVWISLTDAGRTAANEIRAKKQTDQ